MESINPATGRLLRTYEVTSAADLESALQKAVAAQNAWRKVSHDERAMLLRSIATTIRTDIETLSRMATDEMGKPISQSRAELEKCAKTMDFYAEHAKDFLADEKVETEAQNSYVAFRPMGVVLAVMPWNFPYWQVFRAMAPILAGGNAMVLKHASNVSGCALEIQKVLQKAGAPEGLFHTLLLPSSEIEALIARPEIAAVTFTGSTTAGRKVAEAAGRALKKQVLELGGSDPYIILEDADIEAAVALCVQSRLNNSGQSCVSAKRFVVVEGVREAFQTAMTKRMKAATYGDPMDEKSAIGPLARVDLRDELHKQVEKSIENGAKLLCGGTVPDREGAFYPPTVLADVTPGMPAYEEELFGPVAAIISAKDESDAIRIANDTAYGLGGAIFSRDVARAERLAADELQAGSCFVNDFVHSDPRLPFGGVKESGYGRELGIFGLREFVNAKTVFVK